jgi:hypothetical protein
MREKKRKLVIRVVALVCAVLIALSTLAAALF